MHKTITSAIKTSESVSDEMSYTLQSDRWFHTIVLNVHSPAMDRTDDVKHSFYEEFKHVFDKFPTYHTNIPLDFSAKVSKEDIFKLTTANECLNEICNDNAV